MISVYLEETWSIKINKYFTPHQTSQNHHLLLAFNSQIIEAICRSGKLVTQVPSFYIICLSISLAVCICLLAKLMRDDEMADLFTMLEYTGILVYKLFVCIL